MIGDFSLNYKILSENFTYTGKELRPHFVLEKTKIFGSCICAWIGGCDVKTSDLVDQEDRIQNDFIKAQSMLHFVAEFFGINLEAGVLYQRLFISTVKDLLTEQGVQNLKRRGDDLFMNEKKLSVSIATQTPVSVLIHWGFNIDSTGAPVEAIGFKDLKWDNAKVLDFANLCLDSYSKEINDIQIAQCKVIHK